MPAWEQEAVASGVAHVLSLLLDEAGWGVMWRTGLHTRSDAVHRDARAEHRTSSCSAGSTSAASRPSKSGRRKPIKAKDYLSSL